ncbi:MAG: sulfide/dihydroorotate dehydrogenase-like FAD/NAD-binding protein, partial [bacterium]
IFHESRVSYQMYPILSREELAPKIVRFVVKAPDVARKRMPGQFVIVRTHEHGERIPLSIADADPDAGTITLVVQEVGVSSARINDKQAGEALLNVVGPLGKPTEISKLGRVVCIGGGVGIAPLYPITKALREAGNQVVTILGGRSEVFVLLRKEMEQVSDELILCTDDGSLGRKGFVTHMLAPLLDAPDKPDAVFAIGPAVMMRAVCDLTRKTGVRTVVSLNSLMVDGTGMCGGCRVSVGGQARFVCVDGPEFDGHEVDFAEMLQRMSMYREFERRAYERFLEQRHRCQLEEQFEKAVKK